jgi:hypothetical protein
MPRDRTRQESSYAVQPIRGDEGAPIIGPTNPAREAVSPSRLAPLQTDHARIEELAAEQKRIACELGRE